MSTTEIVGSIKSRWRESINMTSTRKISLIAGIFYLLTFVSIPILYLYGPVREAGYIVGPGPDTRVYIGAVLEMIVALAGIGTAVALYPVVKRQNEGVALGFVATRTMEGGAIFAGVVTLMAVVTLRQDGGGAGALASGQMLIGLHDWTFTLSQSLIPALNALLLGSLLYQSRLVPRVLPVLGFVGAALLVTSTMATLFGANEYGSGMSGLLAIPIAIWEFSLGVYLVVKGFRVIGLQQLGFEPVEPVEPAEPAPATAPKTELRPAA
jgi:hypothetical protein